MTSPSETMLNALRSLSKWVQATDIWAETNAGFADDFFELLDEHYDREELFASLEGDANDLFEIMQETFVASQFEEIGWPAEAYVESGADTLDIDTLSYLRALPESPFSLYEVEEVTSDEIHLRDLLEPDLTTIVRTEERLSWMEIGGKIGTRVMDLPAGPVLSLAVLDLPEEAVEEILAGCGNAMADGLESLSEVQRRTEAGKQEVLGAIREMLPALTASCWAMHLVPPPPQEITYLRYLLKRPQSEVAAKLESSDLLLADEEGSWSWVGDTESPSFHQAATIEFIEGDLVAATVNPDVADAMDAHLRELLGKMVSRPERFVVDPSEYLEEDEESED